METKKLDANIDGPADAAAPASVATVETKALELATTTTVRAAKRIKKEKMLWN